MAVSCIEADRKLTIKITGELDHHHARQVMGELDRQIEAALPRELVLDLSGLSFTDSSGIAVLIRAYRRMGQMGGRVIVSQAPAQAEKVFRAAGLHKLMPFE